LAWEAYATFNPAAVVKDGKVFLLYRAEDASGEQQIGGHTSRLGFAESTDGLHFTRRATPVLYPDTDAQRQYEWPGGVEDPRIVESDDGTYILTYTQWNRDVPRLAVATSRDLIIGPSTAQPSHARRWKYLRTESKSGAILSRIEGDRIIATRVNGKYWMYFGVPIFGSRPPTTCSTGRRWKARMGRLSKCCPRARTTSIPGWSRRAPQHSLRRRNTGSVQCGESAVTHVFGWAGAI